MSHTFPWTLAVFESFSGPQLIVLGLMILVIGYLLRRTFVRSKRSRERDPAQEVRQARRAAERSAESGIRHLEVRLYDYGREVEGRVETTLTLLDRLILEAQQETDRLQQLLHSAGQADESSARVVRGTVDAPLDAEERGMVQNLKQAGYTLPQIARFLRRPADEVRAALSQADPLDEGGRADAA
jgi:hypothetical protein